jgi:hypothetical protein
MSRGARLMQWEIEDALLWRACGLTWREIGKILKRDHVGLGRACKKYESAQQ